MRVREEASVVNIAHVIQKKAMMERIHWCRRMMLKKGVVEGGEIFIKERL